MRAMARKKDKIRAELDLPKDDSTLTKLYVILGISMFLGVASFGFWVTNSGFLPTTNDALMFINLACGPEYANILSTPSTITTRCANPQASPSWRIVRRPRCTRAPQNGRTSTIRHRSSRYLAPLTPIRSLDIKRRSWSR